MRRKSVDSMIGNFSISLMHLQRENAARVALKEYVLKIVFNHG